MPAKGISIHVGLNSVDPNQYEGWDGQLVACEFDAKDMQALAKKRGFTTSMLLTSQATSAAVTAALRAAAKKLAAGDYLLVTYSGHGGQVPDTNADEPDGQDETWVLYDRQLVDDELYAIWNGFKSGVRIFVLSDSCHSGSVVRAVPPLTSTASGNTVSGVVSLPAGRIKLLPPAQAARVYRAHKALYDGIQKSNPSGEKVAVKASVILVSGCQDNQVSMDGDKNGLFTENLKAAWRGGKFKGSYRRFRDTIVQRMPSSQTPNYFVAGKANATFEAQVPFAI